MVCDSEIWSKKTMQLPLCRLLEASYHVIRVFRQPCVETYTHVARN